MSRFLDYYGSAGGRAGSAGAAPLFGQVQPRERTATVALSGRWRVELENVVNRLYLFPDAPAPHLLVAAAADPAIDHVKVCAGLAELLSCCVAGPVCLVNSTRGASFRDMFGIPDRDGWHDLLADSRLEVQSVASPVRDTRLWVIGGGSGNATSLPSRDMVPHRIGELRRAFQFVVMDGTEDIQRLALWSEGIVLMIRTYASSPLAARRLKDACDSTGAAVLGVILTA